jgi:hypothetical protein
LKGELDMRTRILAAVAMMVFLMGVPQSAKAG